MVERYGHVEHFCGENLNVHYLFEIVLYRVWHYVMFKNRKIVLIWIRRGQFFYFVLRIASIDVLLVKFCTL